MTASRTKLANATVRQVHDLFHAKLKRQYRVRDEVLTKSITSIRQKYNARGLLYSSMPARDINELFVTELRDNSSVVVIALIDCVRLVEAYINVDVLVHLMTEATVERKEQLEQGRVSTLRYWSSRMNNQSMLEPVRSLESWHHDLLEESESQLILRYHDYLGNLGGRWGLLKGKLSKTRWYLLISASIAAIGVLGKVLGVFDQIGKWMLGD